MVEWMEDKLDVGDDKQKTMTVSNYLISDLKITMLIYQADEKKIVYPRITML